MSNALRVFRKATGVGVCDDHSGKMKDMISVSTTSACNANCQAMQNCPPIYVDGIKCDCICAICYAEAMIRIYKDLLAKLIHNAEILTTEIIPVHKWFVLDPVEHPCLRIEAFGDVANTTQVANYFNVANANPDIIVTAWTKRVGIYEQAVREGYAKPKNFVLIASSPYVNVEIDIVKHPIVDKTFTVYSFDWIVAHDLGPEFINCGARLCRACMKCYTLNNGIRHIHEILKEDSTDVHKYWVLRGWMTHEAASLMLGRKLGKQYSKRMREHEKTMYYITGKRKADRERRKAERMALKAA